VVNFSQFSTFILPHIFPLPVPVV